MLRSVLNVDIAAFPIAVERVIDRGLRDRPVLVAPPGSARAPVLAGSQEAAREGVRAGLIRPDGLCDVFPGSEAPFLAPLPVGLLPAARGTTRERLLDLSVARVADLLRFSQAQLLIAFGPHGGRLRSEALGLDASPVRPPETAAAVVEEETLAEDSNEEAALLRALFGLCERAGTRLRRLRARAGGLRVTLRHSDDVLARREERLAPPVRPGPGVFRR